MSPAEDRYSIELAPAARRQLAKLPLVTRQRVGTAIDKLRADPRPRGVAAFKGLAGGLRLRVGDYRVVYEVHDAASQVLVVQIGHRRQVYDR